MGTRRGRVVSARPALSRSQLEAWATKALRRWPEARAREITGGLLQQAVNELFGPIGQFAEDHLCDVEGTPRLPEGPLRDLYARYELYRNYLS
jgi:hypothetical protein